jgi:Methyltransferase domain
MTVTWREVPGWTNCFDLYDEVALTTPPYTTVVEVGVAFGRSLLYLAERIKRTGKDIRVMAVDPWLPYDEHHFIYAPETAANDSEREIAAYAARHGGIWQAFMHDLYDSGLSDIVDVVRAPSVAAARMCAAPGMRPVHFVFIDGYHIYDAVREDINAWWSLGPEWMAGDDYNPGSELDFPGVWKAVQEKFGAVNTGQRQTTSWVVRRSHLEGPGAGVLQVSEAVRPWSDR